MPVAVPSNLFVQFVEQGVKKGLLTNVIRTLDGESYLDFGHLKDAISKQVYTFGKFFVFVFGHAGQWTQD